MSQCSPILLSLIICSLLGSGAEATPMPAPMRFVDENKLVAVEPFADKYTVTLQVEKQQSVLLKDAICRELSSGYHCFIKPVRVPGILITDVNFARTASGLYDITKIVLINGSMTAVGEIGKDFTLAKELVAQRKGSESTSSL